ncbi:MAG: helix-turn-helix transcriptional regulator [Anaerovoracaceae bacterium]
MAIGERIKQKRNELGMTLEDVAKISGVSRQTIQRYESGVISNIPSDRIESIAKSLNVSPTYLMGWDEKETDNSYYLDPNAAQIAQEVFERPQMKVLFDASRKVSPEDLDFVIDMLARMKK